MKKMKALANQKQLSGLAAFVLTLSQGTSVLTDDTATSERTPSAKKKHHL